MNPACPLALDEETLSAWRDQQLGPEEMRQVAAHLPDCPVCRQRLTTFERIARDLAQRPTLLAGDRIVNAVMAQITYQERGTMNQHTRAWQRGLSATTGLALIVAFALIFTLVLRNHQGATSTGTSVPSTSTAIHATATLGSGTGTPLPFTPIVSVAQAWGAQAGTTLTPRLDSQHYFVTGGISADGQTLFGASTSIPTPGKGDIIDIPGTYGVASGRFTPYAIPAYNDGLGQYVGCCQTSPTFALISQNTQPGATCGVCHTIYYAVNLATGAIHLLTDPNSKNEEGLIGGYIALSQDHVLAETGIATYRLVDLHTDTFSDPLGPPLNQAQDTLISFSWPYLAYYLNPATYVQGDGPAQVMIRDLRTGTEVAIHAPSVSTAEVMMQPFSTHPGTPYPTATPPVAFAGILNGTITGDTFFFISQSPTATTLYEIDHMMTPGAQAQPIAALPNKHDGTLFSVPQANDRTVLVSDGISDISGASTGQSLAYDRAQQRFVDLQEYNHSTAVDGLSINGQALLLVNTAPPAFTSNSVTIYDTAALPGT